MLEPSDDHQVTVVLREDVTRDQVDDACWSNGWLLSDILPASDDAPSRIVFMTPDRLNLVCYFSDPRMGAQFFVLSGSDPDAVAAVIHETLPTYKPVHLQHLLDHPEDADRYLRGVAYSVLSLPNGSPRITEILGAALKHRLAKVRDEALTIAFWSGDSRAKKLVAAASRRDPSAKVRKRARELLGAWPSG